MMRNISTTAMWLTALAFACSAQATEPVRSSPTTTATAISGRIKAIDPKTGESRTPTAAEIANLRSRAALMPRTSALSRLPKTNADALRLMTVAADGTVKLPASQDSFSTLVQHRRPDGTFVTGHGDAEGHRQTATTEEKAGE